MDPNEIVVDEYGRVLGDGDLLNELEAKDASNTNCFC